MNIKQLVNEQYGGSNAEAAKAAGTTEQVIRNMKCQGREVLLLANGNYILLSSKTVIFKVSPND